MKSVKDMPYSQKISAKAVQAHDRHHFKHEDSLTLPTFTNHTSLAKVIPQFTLQFGTKNSITKMYLCGVSASKITPYYQTQLYKDITYKNRTLTNDNDFNNGIGTFPLITAFHRTLFYTVLIISIQISCRIQNIQNIYTRFK